MVNQQKIEELLIGKVEEPTEEESRFNQEVLGKLSLNGVLRRLLGFSMKACLIKALVLLSERKFEEAYASLESFDVVEGLEETLEKAKENTENVEKTKEPKEPNDVIKI